MIGEGNHFYGKKHSKSSKIKMSNSSKGQIAWNKGKKMSEEFKQNCKNNFKIGGWNKGLPPKKQPNWKGGTSDWGHKIAREKMIKKMNRKLLSNEVVHHIDGDKNNNNLKNLKLMTRSEHTKLHQFNRVRGKRHHCYKHGRYCM